MPGSSCLPNVFEMENTPKSSFSFGFSKKKATKSLQKGALEDEDKPQAQETDFVASFDGQELKR